MRRSIYCLIPILLALVVLPARALDYKWRSQETKNDIERLAKKKPSKIINGKVAIVSHHLPTALPLIVDFYQVFAKDQKPQTIYIIGPDHRETCKSKIAFFSGRYLTSYGYSIVDSAVVARLAKAGFKQDNFCFTEEHSIGVQALLTAKFFPQIKIVPILISANAKQEELDDLVKIISQDKLAIVVASIDWAHYYDLVTADKIDKKSLQLLQDKKYQELSLKELDSPNSLYVAAKVAQSWEEKKIQIVNRGNSGRLGGNKKSTTSYINFIFTR